MQLFIHSKNGAFLMARLAVFLEYRLLLQNSGEIAIKGLKGLG